MAALPAAIQRTGSLAVVACACQVSAPDLLEAQQVSDSARAAVLDRLRALSRPPGLDSTLLVDDSVLNAQRNAEANRGQGGSGPDSVATALLGLPGFSVTRYQSAGAEFFAQDRTLSLKGAENQRANVSQDGFELTADSAIFFDEATGRVRSEGAAEFSQPGGDPILADHLLYDLNQDRGTALGAVTTYSEGANWKVRGDMTSVTPVESYGLHATMTSCELDEPHYHFRTGEVKFVNSNWFVARNVTLRFADVPVMWLPFIAQGLGSGRSSGLLPVRFSVNDIIRSSSGYSRRISNLGFYWAMSDYTDMSLAMDWFSERFFSLNGGLGFFWAEQFLRGDLNYRRYWPSGGGNETAFNGQLDWEMNERTKIAVSAAYSTSEDFVRDNSFDPREFTQTINSQGGLNRRTDWGSINIGANRQQHLTDDRVVMKLPTASLSLSPITFLRASGSSARWYNNVTWSGGANYSRGLTDFSQVIGDAFSFGGADNGTTSAGVRSSFNMGGLSFSQTLDLNERSTFDVPLDSLPHDPFLPAPMGIRDISQSEMRWSMAMDFQQNLIGSLTLTPRLSYGGNLFKADTVDVANSFVSGPSKLTFGVATKADFYHIYGGFSNFSAIRHKLATQVSYDWSPEVAPTALQERVFRNSRFIQATNRASITINNTFEAKVKPVEVDSTTSAQADSLATVRQQEQQQQRQGNPDGPRPREQQERVVTLLGLTTSAVQYDFVADSTGRWEDGLQTTVIKNQITSDYLRGLSLSVDWDLFDNTAASGTGGTDGDSGRKFDAHLSSLNMGFSFGARSTVFRWLSRLTGGSGEVPEEPEVALDEDGNPLDEDLGEASIVPRSSDPFSQVRQNPFDRRQSGGGGGWSASVNYSLQRPRTEDLQGNQMLTANLRFEPTELWTVSWRTSYDVNEQAFLDHIVRLSRDLHRWEANFDFRQTLTGNWTFQFAVALKDNRDLKFDYEQRSTLDQGTSFPR